MSYCFHFNLDWYIFCLYFSLWSFLTAVKWRSPCWCVGSYDLALVRRLRPGVYLRNWAFTSTFCQIWGFSGQQCPDSQPKPVALKLEPTSESSGELVQKQIARPQPQSSDSGLDWGPNIYISNKYLWDADTLGPGTTLWSPLRILDNCLQISPAELSGSCSPVP